VNMVSFWPWRESSSSTASFEKTLSTLSTKIAANQSKLDRLRSSSRRIKVLWTLYLTFGYLVYAIVAMIVIGYPNMGAMEWTGMAGGPVLIYTVRTLITAYFNLRIDSTSTRLKEQQAERAKTIQKLKDATKYDSTLELIEKYGGVDGKPAKGNKKDKSKEDGAEGKNASSDRPDAKRPVPGRTNMAPPPTANIQRRDGAPGTPQPSHNGPFAPPSNDVPPEALYAPNADFEPEAYVSPPMPHASGPRGAPAESHWYDRIFDVLLGDDETAPKNRIVLICQSARWTRAAGSLGRFLATLAGTKPMLFLTRLVKILQREMLWTSARRIWQMDLQPRSRNDEARRKSEAYLRGGRD
jgi:hypothetical protein